MCHVIYLNVCNAILHYINYRIEKNEILNGEAPLPVQYLFNYLKLIKTIV